MDSETSGGTTGAVPPPPHLGAGPPRRLTRRPSEGHIGGVCAGLAHYFNIDPLIVRIAAVIIVLSGPGILAYILAWIFVPEATAEEMAEPYGARPTPHFRVDRSSQVLGVILLSLSLIFLWGGWWSPVRRWGFPLALLALGLWLIFRKVSDDDATVDGAVPPSVGHDAPTVDAAPPLAAPLATAGHEGAHETTTEVDGPPTDSTTTADAPDGAGAPDEDVTAVVDPTTEQVPTPPWQAAQSGIAWQGEAPPPSGRPRHHRRPLTEEERAARRRRRMVFPTVMGTLLVWAGIAALAGVGLQASLAVALCLVGLGFVLGAVMGGGKLLVIPALILGGALLATSVLDLPLEGPVGKRHREPATVADLDRRFEVSMGEQVIDLTNLDFGQEDEVTVTASVGIGHLQVRVPEDVDLVIDATVEMGEIKVLGAGQSGVGVEWNRRVDLGDSGRTVNLDLEGGIGQIEVILAESASQPLR